MRLLVLGASGGVGRHAIDQAVRRGHQVRALIRPSAELPAAGEGIEIVRAEPLEEGVILEAARGVEAVISSIGLRRKSTANPWSPLTSPPDLCSTTGRLIVAAMKAASISRLAAVSSAGVAESGPRMNLVMRMLVARSNIGVAYRDLALMEQIYAESGLDWCCVRPVTLTDGAYSGEVREVDHFGALMSISRADVAGYLLDVVEGRASPSCRTPQIAG